MTEKKHKIPLTGGVKMPDALDREISVEAARRNVFKYEVIADAWDCYKASIAQKGYAQVVETDDRKMIITNLLQNASRGDISTLPDASHQELSQLAGRILADAERLAYALGIQAHDARRVSDRPTDEDDEQQALVDEAEEIGRRYPESAAHPQQVATDAGNIGYRAKRRKKA